MLIKLFYDDRESMWVKHTSKKHMVLLEYQPNWVEIRIKDFYPNSPNRNETVLVKFDVFNALARVFFLEQKKMERADKRHITMTTIDENAIGNFNTESIIIFREQTKELYKAINLLTETQARRLILYHINGLTYIQIAKVEGVGWQRIKTSVDDAKINLKNILLQGGKVDDEATEKVNVALAKFTRQKAAKYLYFSGFYGIVELTKQLKAGWKRC